MTIRSLWVLVHRYIGLFMAGFLVIIGLTGSIITFNPELNAWLNPMPPIKERDALALSPLRLRRIAQELAPQGIVNSVNLHRKPGEPYAAYVERRIDPTTDKPYPLDFSVLYLDPYSGKELGRDRGNTDLWPITSKNVMTLINRLHYQLAVPGTFGTYLFGVIALLWTVDCFVSAYLTFPMRRRASATILRIKDTSWVKRWWNPSWLIKRGASFYRLAYDLHRAGGLWLWVLLLVFAWSSVGFNLNEQIYTPVMKAVFGMPDIYGNSLPTRRVPRPEPKLSWEAAHRLGQRLLTEQSVANGFRVVYEDFLFYEPEKGMFLYSSRTSRDVTDDDGNTVLIFDEGGQLLSLYVPTGHNLGSTIHSWIFALHMGKVWGLPYRIFVSLFGVFVAALSITGIYIWWKKWRARGRALVNTNGH
jgi:uncharacterized iron-regulated membrane protein